MKKVFAICFLASSMSALAVPYVLCGEATEVNNPDYHVFGQNSAIQNARLHLNEEIGVISKHKKLSNPSTPAINVHCDQDNQRCNAVLCVTLEVEDKKK